MRYFFEIEFLGKNYFGWQIQPKDISIQQEIQQNISKLLSHKEVVITGCGRTDTGVHAKQYFFHVDLPSIDPIEFRYKLNSMLPEAIVVNKIVKTHNEAHARFDATCRTYRYFISYKKSPFKNHVELLLKHSLNLEAMNLCAKELIGKKDFASFARSNSGVDHTYCEVYRAEWKVEQDIIFFEIAANRFLRNMVRAIVGTLMEVGAGKLSHSEFMEIMKAGDRSKASTSAPAHGLFLWKIEYPFDV